jgi:adenylosuccinate lyase
VARGLVVYPKVIESYVMAELPFMATEEILMAGVRAGGDRQELHELIRKHSLAAAEQVKIHGRPNDLIDRLKGDKAFAGVNWRSLLDARKFTGRASQQVGEFNKAVANPIRKRFRSQLQQKITLRV